MPAPPVARSAGGPLAVLVHGMNSSSRTWWHVGRALAERGWRAVAVDLRGHGSSPRAEQGLGLADLADDVAETVAALPGRPGTAPGEPATGPVERVAALPGRPGAPRHRPGTAPGRPDAEPAGGGAGPAGGGDPRPPPIDLLVGHSLGALVVMTLAGVRPRLARRIVLEDPPGPNGIDWAALADELVTDGRRARTEPGALRAELEAANPGWLPGDAERKVADLAELDAEAIAAAVRPGIRFDLDGLLAATPGPALLLLADEQLGSALSGPDRRAALAALPDGIAVQVVHAGHSIHREALAAYLDVLGRWLAIPADRV